jgi:hypothetical protein
VPIRKAIEKLIDGTVRIPGFQRPFVWEPHRAALLMDSIYKQYPFGSILLWRTRNQLKTERKLGVFQLPPPDQDYPIDYVLDGQQRLTAIFSTFQTSLEPVDTDAASWLPIYYDFAAEEDAQESRFAALNPDEADETQYFPLRVLLDPVAYSRATADLSEERKADIAIVHQRFVETLIPVETFATEDRATVAIVFERVNRMGIELDIFQLLTAWTWSDEFDLQEQFAALADEFSDFGFGAVGDDPDLMLRCTAAVLKGDPAPSALVQLNGAEVRSEFEVVADAIRKAIDFVQANFHAHNLQLLPYTAILIPLAAFFSADAGTVVTNDQRRLLVRWFWRTCFTQRYSGNPQRNIRRDIEEAVKLRKGEASLLGDIPVNVDEGFFLANRFNIRTVATRTFVLLLAQHQPLSFISGQPIKLDKVLAKPNRTEFHHCYPKAKLKMLATEAVNVLANFAIISSADNKKISAKLPSKYRELLPENADAIMEHAAIPGVLFDDDYGAFILERANLLLAWLDEITG